MNRSTMAWAVRGQPAIQYLQYCDSIWRGIDSYEYGRIGYQDYYVIMIRVTGNIELYFYFCDKSYYYTSLSFNVANSISKIF